MTEKQFKQNALHLSSLCVLSLQAFAFSPVRSPQESSKTFFSIRYVMYLLIRKESWQCRYLWEMLSFILYSKSKGDRHLYM